LKTHDNHLFACFSAKDRRLLTSLSTPTPLVMGEVLCESAARTQQVYFPTQGFISLVAQLDGKPVVEMGMIGREGMLGSELTLGVPNAPWHALVQGSGSALRISARAFNGALAQSESLRRIMYRYVYVLMLQQTTSATCLRYHLIGPRLARWLLMTQDRACSDQFHVTHEFLAYMLGVRRVGITTAAVAMQRSGLIEYRRGDMTVLDRVGLENAACSCYTADEHIYHQHLGH
jgi:CRP-like cAMP-binding protein